MKINFRNDKRDILEIEEARIVYRNFSGEETKFNRKGDRNFAVVIPTEELADELINAGYNVRVKPSRDEDDQPFRYLSVKVFYNENGRGPAAYIQSGSNPEDARRLNADTISMLDEIDIESVALDIRPYDWEVNGKAGRAAYLDAIDVIQKTDRFAVKHNLTGLRNEGNEE